MSSFENVQERDDLSFSASNDASARHRDQLAESYVTALMQKSEGMTLKREVSKPVSEYQDQPSSRLESNRSKSPSVQQRLDSFERKNASLKKLRESQKSSLEAELKAGKTMSQYSQLNAPFYATGNGLIATQASNPYNNYALDPIQEKSNSFKSPGKSASF